MTAQGFKDRLSPDISEDPHEHDPGQDAAAVNDHVPHRAAAAADKVLVELVERGEADAENPSGDHQPDSAHAVHVKGECHGDREQEVLREVGKLAHIKMYFPDAARHLLVRELQVECPVSDGHGFVGNFVA